MLADVIKQREQEARELAQARDERYNKPYEREIIVYTPNLYKIGGIETWAYNVCKQYGASLLFDTGYQNQIDKFEENGIEVIKNVGQSIKCYKLICCLWGRFGNIEAEHIYPFIHAIYDTREQIGDIPKHDKIFAVSKVAGDRFTELTGVPATVVYNPVNVDKKGDPLIFGVFSRLSQEKGKERIIYLLEKLRAYNKPFLMFIFTDLPFEYDDNRVVFIKPTLDRIGWMEKMDYIVQLSSTEAGCLTMQEALKIGKPLIITKLPILKEFGVNESNAKILEFDMSNLDIDDLWNIPKVNWHEPVSKEWEDIMKKKVFRERNTVEIKPIVEEIKEEKPKKPATKKKASK